VVLQNHATNFERSEVRSKGEKEEGTVYACS